MRVELTGRARRRLNEVLTYTEETFGPAQVARYEARFSEGLATLQENPRIGRPSGHGEKGLRVFKVAQHRLFYRIEDELILITTILHENQLEALRFEET